MNYSRVYDQLIDQAIERNWKHRRFHRNGVSPERYVEAHHIIPKSLGGADNDSNIVVLTPKEHYVAHHLLAKAFPCRETHAAYGAMGFSTRTRRKLTASQAATAKEWSTSSRRGKMTTEQLARHHAVHVGATRPIETCVRISEAKSGKPAWNKGIPLSEKAKANMRKPLVMSSATCPHCGLTGAAHNMKRYHFDNCKHK